MMATDYLNPHRIYPDCPSRRIDNPPGNDSIRQGSEEKGGRMTYRMDIDGIKATGDPYPKEVTMTGEQFLNSIRNLDYEIKALDTTRVRLEGQRQDILDRAYPASGIGVRVQHGVESKTESLGVKLADMITPGEAARRIERMQARVNRKIDELVDRKERALAVVERMQSPKCKTLILQRYLNNLKWATIADLMGYNEHYVRVDLRREAVAEFSAIFESPTKN